MQPTPTTFSEVYNCIFDYIDRLFAIARPRKLLFMAIGLFSSPSYVIVNFVWLPGRSLLQIVVSPRITVIVVYGYSVFDVVCFTVSINLS